MPEKNRNMRTPWKPKTLTIIQEEVINLLEQSTEPDIGPQFILQFHRNKFAGNKPA